MGSFYVADPVTGTAIVDGDPVVTFVLTKEDHEGGGNRLPVHPSDLYRAMSLPVRGTYADYGQVHVDDEDQIGVVAASLLLGCGSWDEIQEKAFDDKSGIIV